MNTISKGIVGIILGLFLVGAAYYVYTKRSGGTSVIQEHVPSGTGTSTEDTALSDTTEENKITETTVPVPSFPAPDLTRPVTPRLPLIPSVEEDAKKNITRLIEILQTNPDDYSAWIGLGLYRKTVGDYQGAEEVWLYITHRWTADFVAYNNLGNLYHGQLQDFPKAEANFLKAADLRPSFIQSYVNLYELYRYSYKGKEQQAPQALLQGLSKNPTALNLMIALARYYAETGAKESSVVYYKMAIQRAETEKKAGLAESLRKETLESGAEL